MTWITWATVGYFLNAVALAVDKALLNRREMKDPAVYTLLISILGLLVFVLAPWGFAWPSLTALTWGLGSGVFFTLGLWLMFTVLGQGEASRVPAFIGSLNPVFVFLGSFWLLQERLTMAGSLAFVVLVLGGWLMVGGHGGLNRRSLILAVVSAAAFGAAYVFLKITFAETNFISGLIWSRLGGFGSALLLLFIPGTWQRFRLSSQSQGGVKLAFLGGQVSGALAGLFNSYAITLASVTLVNALQGIQYVFLLALAGLVSFRFPWFFQDEFSGRLAVRKLGGTLFIVAGLWLLSLAV
ncbi:MAG: DMT family transporter [Candidatus Kerfeldbacteria bacterium]|nr:DMT family transporter [Candidatus Kerfeldbacteria bacterium]